LADLRRHQEARPRFIPRNRFLLSPRAFL
jgi:hypothetical protein